MASFEPFPARDELAAVFRDAIRAGRTPFPELHDEARRERWRAAARAGGLADRLRRDVEELPAPSTLGIPLHAILDFERDGTRERHARVDGARSRAWRVLLAADHLGLDTGERLDDLAWTECESTEWFIPAHAFGGAVDLAAATRAYTLALAASAAGERMHWRARERVWREIDARVWTPYARGPHFFWRTSTNNWNAVCQAGVVLSALAGIRDADRLADLVRRALDGIDCALDGFTDDGGCSEGPGYWAYGWGWWLRLAAGLRAFTDGAVDLAGGGRAEKVAAIGRYPLAITLGPGRVACFADGEMDGFVAPDTAALANRFGDAPELFAMARLAPDGAFTDVTLETMLYTEPDFRACPYAPARDRALPALGVALARRGDWVLAAKAGHNGEHHNHNDVGSFILLHGGHVFLTDPGAPRYTADTFSARRYENPLCSARGHSVPTVAGVEQRDGERRRGRLVFDPDAPAARDATMTVDYADAYDAPGLAALARTFTLAADGSGVMFREAWTGRAADGSAAPPPPLVEAFVSWGKPAVAADGRSATVPSEDGEATLAVRAVTPGAFSVEVLDDELRGLMRRERPLYRLLFTPPAGAGEVVLSLRRAD